MAAFLSLRVGAFACRALPATSRRWLSFRLREETAHCALEVSPDGSGVVNRVIGLDSSKLPASPARFVDWAAVMGDTTISSGRHYWEVTVKESSDFRVGVADPAVTRDLCPGDAPHSWAFSFSPSGHWTALNAGHAEPLIDSIGQQERIGLLLDLEAGSLGLVLPGSPPRLINQIKAKFSTPLTPTFVLWDGELLMHADLDVPAGLS
ncbi:SPRY domain-containing protein 4-like [Lethenteron reissneri]|uniref:SPRY domain-containing protein 4-like n=1 Tax=Lethenteron reissneri TaxID=7753 RepID=UPI002AB60C46|nr:SPRY domain-containing protein 4-like [Lethenteron reissneri]